MTKTCLAVSQHFDEVFPLLKDRVEALSLRDLSKPPPPGYELIAHLDGFVDSGFERTFTPELFAGLKRHGVRLLSLDLGPACREVKLEEFYKPASPTLPPDELLAAGRERLRTIRAAYDGEISLENLDYHPGGAYEHVCDPDFIRRALTEWDAGLSLDIGHVSVTCFQTRMTPEEYVRRLPLERLVEVHLSRSNGDDDTHALPAAEEYALLGHVLDRATPRFVKLEFYWDAAAIVEHTLRLADFLAARRAAAAP